jgi:hypothetical protein
LTSFTRNKDILQIGIEGYSKEGIDKTPVLRYPIDRYLIDRYLRKGKIKVIEMKKDPWISANDAAEIISGNSGKPVHPDYVRLLARQNPKKLASKPLDGRTNVYLRTDVEKIKVKAKRVADRQTEATQTELPTLESVPTPSTPEKPIPAIPKPEVSQISVSKRLEGLPTSQPPNTMKRGEFVEMYKLNNGPFGKWLENGLGDDKLEATWYISFPNKKKSACFTPEQIAHNLEVLKRHGKLK